MEQPEPISIPTERVPATVNVSQATCVSKGTRASPVAES